MIEQSRVRPARTVATSAAAALLTLVAILVVAPGEAYASDRPTLTFGSLLDPSQTGATEGLLGAIEREILELLQRDYEVAFPDEKRRRSDWTLEGIHRDLDALLADPEVDVVLVIGPNSTAALCCFEELPKPVFAPLGVDGEALGLPSTQDSSGIKNLNYLNNPGASFRDLETFSEFAGFETVHILTDPLIYQVLLGLYERNELMGEFLGIRTIPVSVVSSAEEALSLLPEETEAVYFTPLLRMPLDEMRKLIDGLNARRIPTMSLIGRSEVEMGILAGLRAPTDHGRMARRIALNVQRSLFGEDPGTFSINFERRERLIINMNTARRIGVYPTWRVLTDAELLNEEIPTANSLTLSVAVGEALRANRRVISARRGLAASAQRVKETRADYLPQLDVSLEASEVNGEQAIFRAERNATGKAGLNQVIWSDPLAASIRIQRDRERQSRDVVAQTELDVAAEAASAFLDVLRSKTLERIERDNLRRVETNLELARNRVRIGYASASEVYRWEVERANGKSKVILAGRVIDVAMVRMNQLMFRPQEEPFIAEEPDLTSDPALAVGNIELAQFYDNPWSFRVFRNFLVHEGLENSPEIRQLDAAIAAQRRSWGVAKRAFWSPTIGLRGDFNRVLEQTSDSSPAGFVFPEDQWSIGLSAGLPLFTGGRRHATRSRNLEELQGLTADRENLADRIELRIRTAMFRVAASWTNIDLSREAAEASHKNLDLVTDSYAKGVISIQDLLDAQTSALTADLNASNAVYNFLLDLVEVQRSAGRIEWFKSEEDREAWLEEIRDYFEQVRRSGEDPGGFE